MDVGANMNIQEAHGLLIDYMITWLDTDGWYTQAIPPLCKVQGKAEKCVKGKYNSQGGESLVKGST
jgi:hypothetical protein